MPMEYRRLRFTGAELRDALETQSGTKKSRLPAGDIVALSTARRKNRFEIDLVVIELASRKARRTGVPEDVVKSALIEFCIRERIPLPRNAEKTLRIVDDRICLDVNIGEAMEDVPILDYLKGLASRQDTILDELRRLHSRAPSPAKSGEDD
ncbi:MAG: hypothetical protein QGG17_07805 [Rhodospirillales bacterium]|nr:hypothetical protein [Rhodospirillales bacterium]MDP6805719.1 hypothetical protein [Rhodospirillales bacterium]